MLRGLGANGCLPANGSLRAKGFLRANASLRANGFSLLELLLAVAVMAVTTVAALTVHSHLWAAAWQQQQASAARQGFYALGYWLQRELQQELQVTALAMDSDVLAANPWHYDASLRCLLYLRVNGTVSGIRLRQKALQWKPEQGDCNSTGWLNLHDPALFSLQELDFTVSSSGQVQLCLWPAFERAVEREQTGQAAAPWCYSWWGRR